MPEEKPDFQLHVKGKEEWSWADIEPNWLWKEKGNKKNPNGWNEVARDILKSRSLKAKNLYNSLIAKAIHFDEKSDRVKSNEARHHNMGKSETYYDAAQLIKEEFNL